MGSRKHGGEATCSAVALAVEPMVFPPMAL